jgi:hypothetical protein
MYFWKIKKLKEDIKNNHLTSKDNFLYLISYVTVYSIFLMIAVVQLYETLGLWMAIIQILLFIGGTYYAFYSNNGVQGRDFSKRFFSIGWVFLLRATFFMGIGMLNLYVMTQLFGFESLFTVKNSAVIALVFEVLFYWRIGRHIADVRK